LTGLTSGSNYMVELWCLDDRSGESGRKVSLGDTQGNSTFPFTEGSNAAPFTHELLRHEDCKWGGLPDKIYVGFSARSGNLTFDSVFLGEAPKTIPAAPGEIMAGAFSAQANLSWKTDRNTVFCDVLRAEQKVSPAGYSGRGPNSNEVSVSGL